MHPSDLENLCLLIVRDGDGAATWTERWAQGYPAAQSIECRADQSCSQWQQAVQAAFACSPSAHFMLVGHGVGALAAAAWYSAAPLRSRQRIAAVILTAPVQAACNADKAQTLQRLRFQCKAALVVGRDDPLCPRDWAVQQAALWQARLLDAPQHGHLDRLPDGWQWGMKLMQEMLLA